MCSMPKGLFRQITSNNFHFIYKMANTEEEYEEEETTSQTFSAAKQTKFLLHMLNVLPTVCRSDFMIANLFLALCWSRL